MPCPGHRERQDEPVRFGEVQRVFDSCSRRALVARLAADECGLDHGGVPDGCGFAGEDRTDFVASRGGILFGKMEYGGRVAELTGRDQPVIECGERGSCFLDVPACTIPAAANSASASPYRPRAAGRIAEFRWMRLIEVGEVWRDCGGSTERAAKQLFVHPNTVRQRLHRIAEATGCSLTAPRDVAELCLVLEAARQ